MPLGVFWGQRKPGAKWLGWETALASALTLHEDGLCKGCGEPLDESTHPDNEFAYGTGDPIRCHSCTALEVGREKVTAAKYHLPEALRLRLSRRSRGGAETA